MKIKTFLSFCIGCLMMACAPTASIQKTWSDASLPKDKFDSFKKVMVIATLKDETSRRIGEDKLAVAFKNNNAVQSYNYLAPADTTQQAVEKKLKADGFDAVVFMRLKGVEKSVTYMPGTAYAGWYGYRYPYSSGYFTENKTYVVETNIYDVTTNKLIWSTTTETLNPRAIERSLDGIIVTIKKQMIKDGLIKL